MSSDSTFFICHSIPADSDNKVFKMVTMADILNFGLVRISSMNIYKSCLYYNGEDFTLIKFLIPRSSDNKIFKMTPL